MNRYALCVKGSNMPRPPLCPQKWPKARFISSFVRRNTNIDKCKKIVLLSTNMSRWQARSQGGGGGGGVGGVVRPPLQAEGPHFGHPISKTFAQLHNNIGSTFHDYE